MVEHEGNAAACSKGTAALGEVAADVCNGTGVVVSCCLYKVGDTVRAVAFVYNLLEVSKGLVGSLLDGALDVLFRHLL